MVIHESCDEPAASAESFATFYRVQYQRAARLAFVLTNDRSAAEDLAQEAFVRLQPKFETALVPEAYLRTTLVNVCRAHHRRSARERIVEARLPREGSIDAATWELLDVIAALPYRQRVVVVLRYFEDLTEHEIAATLQCRPGTVKSLAARALARMRREIEQ